MELKTEAGRKKAKLQIMGAGGLGLASVKTGIRYWRLSRILNGWLDAKEIEIEKLREFVTL